MQRIEIQLKQSVPGRTPGKEIFFVDEDERGVVLYDVTSFDSMTKEATYTSSTLEHRKKMAQWDLEMYTGLYDSCFKTIEQKVEKRIDAVHLEYVVRTQTVCVKEKISEHFKMSMQGAKNKLECYRLLEEKITLASAEKQTDN